MRGFRANALRGGRGVRGHSLRDFLIALAVLIILASLFLPVFRVSDRGHHSPRCWSKLQQYYQGLRMYLNNNDDYLPLAWHVGGKEIAEDFSNLTYYRFLIHCYCETDFRPTALPADSHETPGDGLPPHRGKYERDARFWKDGGKGWTDDYFAPSLIFKMPEDPAAPLGEGVTYSGLTMDVPSTERPLLSEVNASLPNAKAKDPTDPGHELEMRNGFSFVRDAGIDVFIGVGPSLRRAGDYATSRFDFRHKGYVNVLFLDGHMESVSSSNTDRLRRIHDRWNNLVPGPGK